MLDTTGLPNRLEKVTEKLKKVTRMFRDQRAGRVNSGVIAIREQGEL
jgi:hypothetical protein